MVARPLTAGRPSWPALTCSRPTLVHCSRPLMSANLLVRLIRLLKFNLVFLIFTDY